MNQTTINAPMKEVQAQFDFDRSIPYLLTRITGQLRKRESRC